MAKSRARQSEPALAAVVNESTPIFTRLRLENFRGVSSLDVPDLAPISIFTGQNGSGKTTVLEAAWLLAGLNSASLVEPIARARGLPIAPGSDLIFSSMFRQMDMASIAKLSAWSGLGSAARSRTLEIRRLDPKNEMRALAPFGEVGVVSLGLELTGVTQGRKYVSQIAFARLRTGESVEAVPVGAPMPEPIGLVATPFTDHRDFVHAAFLRPGWRAPHQVHDLLVRAKRERADRAVVDVLKALVPALSDVQPYAEGGMPMIHVDLGEGPLMPAQMLGSGFANLLDIAIWVGASPAKLVLIDEIEDGLHYSVLPNVAKAMLELVRSKGLQFLTTTHSRDVVSAFAEAASNLPDAVAFFNLVRWPDHHEAVRYTSEEALDLLSIRSDVR